MTEGPMAGGKLGRFAMLDYRGHCSYTYFFLLVYFSPSLLSSLSTVDTDTDTNTDMTADADMDMDECIHACRGREADFGS